MTTTYHTQQGFRLPTGASIFHTPDWLETMYPGEWQLLACSDNNELVAWWPMRHSRKWGFRLLVMPPLTPYLGPCFRSGLSVDEQAAVWASLTESLPRHHYLSQQLLPGVTLPELSPGWHAQELTTHILDLQHGDDIRWKQCNTNTQRNIKKGQQLLTIREGNSYKDLWRLKEASYRHKGNKTPNHPLYLERATNYLISTGKGFVLEALDRQGEVVGAILVAVDGPVAHYLYGAAHPMKGTGALAYLLWEGIRKVRGNDVVAFNFEGSRIPGIARFFKGFGAHTQQYYLLNHTPNVLLRRWLLR